MMKKANYDTLQHYGNAKNSFWVITFANGILKYFFLFFFPINRDNLHKVSELIFWKNREKNIINLSPAELYPGSGKV